MEASGHPGHAHLFAGGWRKQEMRDCKAIKILLAICPSSHRSEDFLSQPELWNMRLSCVSFLLTLFLLSWFAVWWASCHFHCAGFSSCSASFPRAFTELRFCCAWSPRRGCSARLNMRSGTKYVRGVCNFLGSVSLQQKFEATDEQVL